MKILNEVERLVKMFKDGKWFKEEPKVKPMRMWVRSYNGYCIILLNFRTFPDVNADFNTYAGVATHYLSQSVNHPRLISDENLAQLHVLYDGGTDPEVLDLVAIIAKLNDPKSKGPYWEHQAEVRRHEIEQKLLDVFHDIAESTWNATDRDTLRRPAKSTDRHENYIMEVAPELTIRTFWHKAIKVHLHNPETPETDAMPKYQHVRLEWFIGPANTVLSSIVPNHSKDVHRALYLLTFLTEDVDKTLFVRATYVNSIGDASEIIGDWVLQLIS